MKIDFLGNHLNVLPELAKLQFDEWRHFSPGATLEDRVIKLQNMAQSNDVPFMVVAADNDRLIGSAALTLEDMRTRKYLLPWLASVFVKPEFRRSGMASLLVRHIEDKAMGLGSEKLFLYTEHARGLYLKLGWRDIEQCEYQGVNVAIMSKQFSA
ncbi:MAG: GNAT family N-acetyltransferase [Betaproteobacteria bacterium]|nr:MAG: GNAT family N-acetyltransferase [Betaproteobacteria bacterium]